MTSPLRNPIRELAGVWRETRLIVLVAQIAAIYAAVLIPFKVGIPLVPGFAELRPANALPIVASLLFGPAAAWGAAFGNLIGDCFGTLGLSSVFGFLGNFFYGYVPYLLWGRLGPLSSGQDPEPRSWRQVTEFVLVTFAASLVCALVIAWGVDLLGLVPFGILAVAIFTNNFFMALLLAPPLLLFLTPRVTKWGLRYEDIRESLGPEVRGKWLEQTTELERGSLHAPSPAGSVAAGQTTSEPSRDAMLQLENVSFTYRGSTRPALDCFSLTVHRGESMAIMGRTGSGKSTFCYTLNGLIPHFIQGHSSGRVTVDGVDTRQQSVWQQARTVGLLFQEFEAQLVSTNIEMELAFPLEHATHRSKPLSRAEIQDRITRTLGLVGLTGLEHRDPASLSSGQRQRLVLASILVREPTLLALDEPFTDLDPDGRRALRDLLGSLKRSGATLVIVEHDPEGAALADHVCVMEQGRVLWEGQPRTLFGHSAAQRFARQFGLKPMPLAECFEGFGLPDLPLTLEEAWRLADDQGLRISPQALQDDGPPATRTPSEQHPIVIEVQHASYVYEGGTPALSDVEFHIRQGEFVAVVGQNGSGKSTLASLLKGLRQPTAGAVHIQGEDTRRLTAGQLASRVGYVFQNPDHQIFAESVESEVAFAGRNLGMGREDCDQRVAAALHAVGLDAPEVRHLDPFSLTKGDRQRVAVASVLAARPGIVIFDEPTTGLDVRETDHMMLMLKRLNEEGQTIIMITHALSLVATYAHRCIILRDGRLVADGPTRTVFTQLLDPAVAASTGLQVPQLTQFAARWGPTVLTVEEVRRALTKN